MAATIFLMVVVAVSAMTIGITPHHNTEAQTTGGGGGDDLRFIWRTTESQREQRNFANQYLDSSDIITIHYPHGGDPTTEQINALKGVTTVPNSRKALEFFSLAEIKEHAKTVKSAGFGMIAYDLEPISPSSDVRDPVRAVREADRVASAHGLQLMLVPSQKITRDFGAQFAPYIDRIAIQSQIHQDNDEDCTFMRDWLNDRVAELERANPNLSGKILGQVTLTQYAAPGKTVYETAQDCMDVVSGEGGGDNDGLGFWWNPREWNNGQVASLTRYYESKYS